jgi:hypothetical protein
MHLRHHQGHCHPMMDAEFHRVPNTIGEIQEALLLIHIASMDENCRSIRSLLDP